MHALHIGTSQTRLRLPAHARDAQQRLQDVQRHCFEEGLEIALAKVGLSPHDEVCLREVHLGTRLRLSRTSHELTADLSHAVAEAIAETVRAGGPNVVHYTNRLEALRDLALCTARGDDSRAWAWRQLGLISGSESTPGSGLVQALEREPEAILPTLRALAENRAVGSLRARLPQDAWRRLACAAFSLWGLADPLTSLENSASSLAEGSTRQRTRLRSNGRSSRFVEEVLDALSHDRASADLRERRALVALAALEFDPQLLSPQTLEDAVAPLRVADEQAHTLQDTVNSLLDAAEVEARPADTESPHRSAADHHPTMEAPEDLEVQRSSREPTTEAAVAPAEPREAQRFPSRIRASTRYGGILLLLNLLPDCDGVHLVEQIAEVSSRARPMSWWLHELARRLAPIDADDPAALVFSGVGLSSPSSRQRPAVQEHEEEALQSWRSILSSALEGLVCQEGPDLRDLCRRDAEICDDLGWIEVTFPTSAVDLRVRRVGLDLDPDFVPWLGSVVRFLYR